MCVLLQGSRFFLVWAFPGFFFFLPISLQTELWLLFPNLHYWLNVLLTILMFLTGMKHIFPSKESWGQMLFLGAPHATLMEGSIGGRKYPAVLAWHWGVFLLTWPFPSWAVFPCWTVAPCWVPGSFVSSYQHVPSKNETCGSSLSV